MLFNNPTVLMWIVWFFTLFCSFASFYIALNILKINSNKNIQFFSSLIYVFNLYTLGVFAHQFFNRIHGGIYIIFPVLFALTYEILRKDSSIDKKLLIPIFSIIIFLFIFIFGNPAFFLMFFGLIALLSLILLLFGKLSFRHLLIYFIVLVISLLPLILPTVLYMSDGLKGLSDANVNGLSTIEWLKWQSPLNIDAIRMESDTSIFSFFEKFSSSFIFYPIFVVLSFLYLILFIISFLYKQEEERKNELLIIIFFSFIILFILASKLTPPFSDYKLLLNQLPLFITLRSTEKILLFLPFYIILGISILFNEIKNKKFIYTLIVLLLIIPFPLYVGNVFTNFNVSLNPGDNYLTSDYSLIVKIPDEYYKAADMINSDNSDFRIMSLPYSIVNSENWMNYPKWKHVGSDPVQEIINKPILNPNQKINNWFFSKTLSENNLCKESLIYFASNSNVKYIIYHKDVPDDFVKIKDMDYFVENRYISKIMENDYFVLYELSENYRNQEIFSPKEIIPINNEDNFLDIVSKDFCNEKDYDALYYSGKGINPKYEFSAAPEISYEKINPTRYHIKVSGISGDFPLILSQKYSKLWVIDSKVKLNENHFMVNGYLNAWILKPDENINEIEFDIAYQPQKYFLIGLTLSMLNFIIMAIYLTINIIKLNKIYKIVK